MFKLCFWRDHRWRQQNFFGALVEMFSFLPFSIKLAVEVLSAEDWKWGWRNSVCSHASPSPSYLLADSEYSLTAAETNFGRFFCSWHYRSLNTVRYRILSNPHLSEGLALPSHLLSGFQKSVGQWLTCVGGSRRVWHSFGQCKHAQILAWKGVGWDNPVCRGHWLPWLIVRHLEKFSHHSVLSLKLFRKCQDVVQFTFENKPDAVTQLEPTTALCCVSLEFGEEKASTSHFLWAPCWCFDSLWCFLVTV